MKIIRLGMGEPASERDLLVPTHRVLHVPAPGSTLDDIHELPYRLGGRAVKPSATVAFRGQRGNVTLLPGLGVTEAAEIQDLAYRLYERDEMAARVQVQPGALIDRERLGMPSRETFDTRYREHMAAKLAFFKAHRVTNPGHAPYERKLL